jgi:hypothetical protein
MTIIYDEVQKGFIYNWRIKNKEKYLEYCRKKAKQHYIDNSDKIKLNQKSRYIFNKEWKRFLAISTF